MMLEGKYLPILEVLRHIMVIFVHSIVIILMVFGIKLKTYSVFNDMVPFVH